MKATGISVSAKRGKDNKKGADPEGWNRARKERSALSRTPGSD